MWVIDNWIYILLKNSIREGDIEKENKNMVNQKHFWNNISIMSQPIGLISPCKLLLLFY